MPTGSLRKKALKGVGWSTAESLLSKGVTFIVGIVLARLLSPAEYGMIGMAMVLVVILDSIADSGLAQAIIRKKTVTDDDLNTMFLAHLVVSVVMYAILFACGRDIFPYGRAYSCYPIIGDRDHHSCSDIRAGNATDPEDRFQIKDQGDFYFSCR